MKWVADAVLICGALFGIAVLLCKMLKRRRKELEFQAEVERIGRNDAWRAEIMKGSREVKPK